MSVHKMTQQSLIASNLEMLSLHRDLQRGLEEKLEVQLDTTTHEITHAPIGHSIKLIVR
jgi:hypothetical protein